MRPLIGITTSFSEDEEENFIKRAYVRALEQAGGVPLLLPAVTEPEAISRMLDTVDGVLLEGGDDLDPAWYGATPSWQCGHVCFQRDAFELALCHRLVQRKDRAVLGICRGIQVMNVALGGTLYQDLKSELPQSLAHQQKALPCYVSHPIQVDDGSPLHDILGMDRLMVNSHHHQAMREVAPTLTAIAHAPDGVVEAVALQEHPFFLGVQWHPERLCDQPHQLALFKAFVQASGEISRR